MDIQGNLFGPPASDDTASAPAPRTAPAAAPVAPQPLAVPCGYRNRTNARCERLAHCPVLLDGQPLMNRGQPLLHCDPSCFNPGGTVGTAAMLLDDGPPDDEPPPYDALPIEGWPDDSWPDEGRQQDPSPMHDWHGQPGDLLA